MLFASDLRPDEKLIDLCKKIAEHRERSFFAKEQAAECMRDADVVYTDVFVSMGEEDQFEERLKKLMAYQVDIELMKKCAKFDVLFSVLASISRSGNESWSE